MAVTESGSARRRNPRGQGEKLRDDIIEAASRLLADPASPPLTLRAVARAVGVAATSVYLHFADIQSLVVAVADRRFSELVQVQEGARDATATPRERVLAGCVSYCEFGLAHPGHYQVMFVTPVPMMENVPVADMPGYRIFEQLVEAVAATIAPADPAGRAAPSEAFTTAVMIWQQLHGIVSLRISRPRFPWPPLHEAVTTAITRILPPP
jgi:AcrR family transcriptional regulator